jgi:hypothetical protein
MWGGNGGQANQNVLDAATGASWKRRTKEATKQRHAGRDGRAFRQQTAVICSIHSPHRPRRRMHRKRLMMHRRLLAIKTVTKNPKPTSVSLIHRKRLMIDAREANLGKLEYSTIARRPGLSCFQCGAFRFADRDHLFRVRTRELASAGETTAAPNLREILT